MRNPHLHSLNLSVAAVFIVFGLLKLVPGLSPAEHLAIRTLDVLSAGLLEPLGARLLLAAGEVAIGIGLLVPRTKRVALGAMFLHLAGTFTPYVLFPGEMVSLEPFGVTLLGQYIAKNVVLISAGVVLWNIRPLQGRATA